MKTTKSKMLKKIIAFFLATLILCSSIPMQVFAAGINLGQQVSYIKKANKDSFIMKRKEGRNCICDLLLFVITNYGGPRVETVRPVSNLSAL